MTTSSFTIPAERLPPGFAERIETPPQPPAEPRPAATVVLMRDADAGLDVLLLRRNRHSGFVPGAYVFPGGVVDAADGDDALPRLVRGVASPPPHAYWVAAARELFEEAGVLLARREDGEWVTGTDRLVAWRNALLDDELSMPGLLQRERMLLDLSGMAYCAHWITPEAEPRRYDTRFFVAALPDGASANADAREMTDARWVTPRHGLDEFAEGNMPMVFPTVRTLELLSGYDTVEDALAGVRATTVEAVLPRLVRAEGGVAIVVDDSEKESA
jgi:8-oxo-dGTP pyrophosphatase MutT (NUDIX family)